MNALDNFHFLRPLWLLALPALWLLLWLMRDHFSTQSPWRQIIDPALLPHLNQSSGIGTGNTHGPLVLAVLGTTLASLALAGPSWRQLPQPVYDSPLHRVLVMDLSTAMNAADIKPSRLARSKLLAQQLLNNQQEGDTALVAFAAEAFAVVPLTSDRGTVSHLLSSLSTELMPSTGDNLAAGINEARHLLEQGGANRGDIIVLTASPPDAAARDAVEHARQSGFRTHILAAGTPQGAPIPAPGGGWQRDSRNAITLARLPANELAELARSGGGLYRRVDQAGADFRLKPAMAFEASASGPSEDRFQADQWQDEGAWLLLPLILIAASAFRRGWLFGLLLCLPLLQPQSAYAGWWKTQDQQALEHFQAGDFATAADNFKQREWRASALYEAGEYEKAAELWGTGDRASDAYNQGNALARSGDLQAAIEAYAKALQRDPQLSDAQANRDLLEKLLEQQQQQQQQQQNDTSQSAQDDSSTEQQTSDADAAQDASNAADQAQSQQDPSSAENAQSAQGDDAQNADAQQNAPDENSAGEQSDSTQTAHGSDEAASEETSDASVQSGEFSPEDEQAQAVQQWLKRIPDDPGGLLRRKFERMQQRRQAQ